MIVVFDREFNWRRPQSSLSFNAKASTLPRSVVHDFGAAAIAAGAARRVQTTTPHETAPP